MATNPDNVGGLRDLLRETYNFLFGLGSVVHPSKHEYVTGLAKRIDKAAGELCRAAPAGGDDVETLLALVPRPAMAHHKMDEAEEREIKRVNRFRDRVIDNIRAHCASRPDSATAGSVEVEALVQKWRDESESGFDGDGNLSDTWTAQAKRACADELAALIRKLQQGVDGWRPIESAPKEDGLKILGASNAPWTQDYYPVLVYEGYRYGSNKQYFGWQAPFDHDDRAPDPTHWMPLPAPPASQGQEGGK